MSLRSIGRSSRMAGWWRRWTARWLGLGGVTSYGPFAWLGLMAVDPARQRRGIGQTLVEALVARAQELGSAVVLLDASDAGAPVYERVGFVDDDRVRVYTWAAQRIQRDRPR